MSHTTRTACAKCGGLVIDETSRDPESARILTQVRCLNCGRREEPGHVPQTRLAHQPETPYRGRKTPSNRQESPWD